jgi:hypothetical protein
LNSEEKYNIHFLPMNWKIKTMIDIFYLLLLGVELYYENFPKMKLNFYFFFIITTLDAYNQWMGEK